MNRLEEAEQMLREAERLDRARGTPPAQVALAHHGNLGVAAAQRGDLARAEVYFRSNLEAVAVAAPESLDRARATLNLATLIAERGDTARALTEFEAGASLLARVAPNSALHAGALINVGSARTRLGDVAGGTRAFDEARTILAQSSPDSATLGSVLANLARNAQRRGELQAAAALAAEAVAHLSRVAPAGVESSFAHHVAGLVAAERGATEDARRSQETVVRMAQTTAPGTRWAVPALTALAELDVRDGRLDQAASRYAEALEVLGTQVRRMGAALDVEAAFLDHANVQRPYVDVLLALGRQDAALEAIENVRARAVLDRLATRDLSFGRADEAGRLARERRSLAAAYDQTLAQAARLPANAPEAQVRQVQTRLADLRERQALAASNLRRVDPALAEQLDPSPARASDLQRGLPRGTLALVYHLGAERPSVFAVSREALRVAPLGEPAARLAARVGTWRRLMARGRTTTDSDPELDDEARALYAALIAPVAVEVSRATRVVVVPDGVLHGLAFGALRRDSPPVPGGAAGAQAYVAAWKPTTVAPSLSALALLAARPRHGAGERTAVVVGDASFADAPGAAAEGERRVRSAVIEGLPPLPGSRREAEEVARTFSSRARLLLGDAATEPAVKGVARETAILHIATHGVVNDLTPLDSALVLAAPAAAEDDNGLLQAWEIFDQVRIDADLVVLSACDTGLGRTFAGEGLLGLTRAFQFAGARAVVASLWKAPDAATAALMERFYREMASGRPAAEALATAQRALASNAATAHPFHWAGFVVDGDGW
ncbi:MAG: CHAT domain-containing protein [Vicinamibacterales bacterium]